VTKEAGNFLAPLLARLVKRLTEATGEGRCAQGVHLLADGQEHCFVCPVPSLRCPACTSRMVPLEVHGQTVDVCTLCPGMWLDANELTALRSAQPQRPSTRREPQDLPGSTPEGSSTFLGKAGDFASMTIGEVVAFVIVEAISGLFS
jgi:Transcription factor zinc-finger